jgi:hypothetical protein
MVMRLDLAQLTLAFLALPYLIFIPGWLNTPTAVITLAIFCYSLFQAFKNIPALKNDCIHWHDVMAFLLILLWLHLSGSGGYGHQSYDYVAHNARLNDMITMTWPIRYDVTRWGQGHNLVFYTGYFLPAAIIGKLSSFKIATQALHLWTLLAVTLALRWLSVLSEWRFSFGLVLLFILFGPQDIFGMAAIFPFLQNISWHDYWRQAIGGDTVEFWASQGSNIFFGNFLSNTTQLFWSPPQVLSGWLMIALLTFLFLRQQLRQIVFIYSLLCLWAPLAMLALLPFIAAATLPVLFRQPKQLLTLENVLGAGSLTIIFLSYYLAGSAINNPNDWIWVDELPLSFKLFTLSLFYLFTWGLYVLAISPAIKQADKPHRFWFLVLLLAMFALPLHSYGNYNDLMCRGSAPLMFLLLIFVLRSLAYYRLHRQTGRIVLLGFLLLAGTGSALSQLYVAINQYGITQPVRKVTDYRESRETLGPDGTFFEKYFRKPLASTPLIQHPAP